MERLARHRDHADPAERQEDRHRADRRIHLLREDPPQIAALLRRRPHQRYLGVVTVEVAARKGWGNRFRGAKVHHVEASGSDNGGNPAAGRRIEPRRARAEDPADELIGPFGRRHVEDARHGAAFDQRLHRPPASACGVKHDDVAASRFDEATGPLDARGRVAEHRSDDEGLCAAPLPCRSQTDVGVDERADRGCRPGELAAREGIEPRDIRHRRDHHDVADVEVGGDVPAGECRHHHFRDTERQSTHRCRANRRSSRSPHRHDCHELSLGMEPADDRRRRGRHRCHHLPPIAPGLQGRQIDAPLGGHSLARDVGFDLRHAEATAVDEEGLVAKVADSLGEEAMLVSFGVERTEDDDRAHLRDSCRGMARVVWGKCFVSPLLADGVHRSGGPRR